MFQYSYLALAIQQRNNNNLLLLHLTTHIILHYITMNKLLLCGNTSSHNKLTACPLNFNMFALHIHFIVSHILDFIL